MFENILIKPVYIEYQPTLTIVVNSGPVILHVLVILPLFSARTEGIISTSEKDSG